MLLFVAVSALICPNPGSLLRFCEVLGTSPALAGLIKLISEFISGEDFCTPFMVAFIAAVMIFVAVPFFTLLFKFPIRELAFPL